MGCPLDYNQAPVCPGYEPTDSLDFDTNGDDYWNDSAGWEPTGGQFTGVFDGSENVILNLFINRSSADNSGCS